MFHSKARSLGRIAGLLLLLWPLHALAREPESMAKAEMIYNLVLFVSWPEHALPSETGDIGICVLDGDAFGITLREKLGDLRIEEHPLAVYQVDSGEQARNCHLLFIGRSEEQRLEEVLDELGKTSVLTVSDINEFCIRGGMIELIIENGRREFDLNSAAVENAGLRIGSELKRIARQVHCGESGEQ